MSLRTLNGQVYRNLIKPVFFQFDPELVHNTMVRMGKMLGATWPGRKLTSAVFSYQNPKLGRSLDGIYFPNPVGLSAGFDYNGDLTNILPAVGFGFHTIGTVTLESYEGNTKPRLGRLPGSQALIVNKGLKNAGAKAIIDRLEKLTFSIPTGISIASTNKHYPDLKSQLKDIVECFVAFESSRLNHAYYELNISCPNTFGGEPFTTPDRLTLLLNVLERIAISRPIYVKMPIDQSPAESLALLKVIDQYSIAGVILGNLTKDKTNPAVQPADLKIWKTRQGNLSGKPTWERSNRFIALTKKHFGKRFTIIGTGGIFSPVDAAHKIALGADLVQLITGMIYQGPNLIGEINEYLAQTKESTKAPMA